MQRRSFLAALFAAPAAVKAAPVVAKAVTAPSHPALQIFNASSGKWTTIAEIQSFSITPSKIANQGIKQNT